MPVNAAAPGTATSKPNLAARDQLLCPSARPEMDGSFVFGVIDGPVSAPLVAYLAQPQPVTDDLLLMTQPAAPTEVFRFAAPCVGTDCQHFDGTNCQLAARIAKALPQAVDGLPPCAIRPSCRWWNQEGKAACLRCPQVVSLSYMPSDSLRYAATPVET